MPTSMTVVDDEHVELAGLEAAHDGVLLLGLHAAVHAGEAQARERAGRELAHHRGRGAERRLLGLLDERVDDVRLVSGRDLARGCASYTRSRRDSRQSSVRDRRPARRQLVERRDGEVAVERQRERARDRASRSSRGRRAAPPVALALERRALQDAEAVLLVDDGEPEAVEARRPPG